jgi:hypothetical protein
LYHRRCMSSYVEQSISRQNRPSMCSASVAWVVFPLIANECLHILQKIGFGKRLIRHDTLVDSIFSNTTILSQSAEFEPV